MQSIGDYLLSQKLGDGFSGSVRIGTHKKTSQAVAIKSPSAEVMVRHPQVKSLLAYEFEVLSRLRHPHIVRPVEFARSATFRDRTSDAKFSAPMLALELAANGEICEIVVETGRLSSEAARYYFWQLLNALDFVHGQGLAHRDVKLENLLLDDRLELKLIDFAFATEWRDSASKTRAGTEGYLPPEAFSADYSDDLRTWDLFALGVALFAMARGAPAFVTSRPEDPFYKLLSKNPKSFWAYQKKVDPEFDPSPAFCQLIEGLLREDPKTRFTVRDVLANEWYNSPVDEATVKREMTEKVAGLKKAQKAL